MRQILYILVAAVALSLTFTACEEDNKGKLDPSAKVYISPAPGVPLQTPTKVGHLTAHEIVKQAERIITNHWTMGIGEWNRDLVDNRFIISASWAVAFDGTLETGLIEARDYIFVILNEQRNPVDTIAYIPNETMRVAEKAIKEAYAAGNYASCYSLLEDAFIFTPITGNEWLKLKDKNEN